MNKLYYYLILVLLFFTSWTACQSNKKQTSQFQDSLVASNSTEGSILTYADGLEKLKNSLELLESPVYAKGDYAFFTTIYRKDSLPVLYEEYGDSGKYGFIEKKYYLDDGKLDFYVEKSKQSSSGENPDFEFKEVRIYFRNNVFLKAEERVANSDSLLAQLPFSSVDERLIDKNKQVDFKRLDDATAQLGNFNLTFDRIDSISPNKKHLVMANKNTNTYESIYQIQKVDSLILKIIENPYAYKGKKLKILYTKQGTKMLYKSGEMVHL